MATQLIIRIPPSLDFQQVSWLRLDDQGNKSPITTGPLSEVAGMTVGARVAVLIPSTDVLLTSTMLPTQNRQKMLKALPYALEDQLMGDLEELHFALGVRDADGVVHTAVIEKEVMDKWQAALHKEGLVADYLIPDVFAMPVGEGQWQVLQDDEQVLVRVDANKAFSVDAYNAGLTMELLLKEQKERAPQTIAAWNINGQLRDEYQIEAGEAALAITVERQQSEKGLLGIVAEHGFDPKQAINLLQGVYSRREQMGKYFKPWRTTAILLGVWFVILWGMLLAENISLQAKSDKQRDEMVTLYKQAFPGSKNIPKPKAQMEAKLKELRGGGGSNGSSFVNMMGKVGPVFNRTSDLQLANIRYKTGQLDIELSVPSLQVLDQLKQQLAAIEGLDVEIHSAASKDNLVQGRLQIKGRG